MPGEAIARRIGDIPQGLWPWGFSGGIIVQISLCRAKIHRATVTEANLDYEGSITIDKDLVDAAGLLPYEMVQVLNVNTGARLETYVIVGPAGSGVICLNGAAARLGAKGDKVIIIASGWFSPDEARFFKPAIVHVDANNKILSS